MPALPWIPLTALLYAALAALFWRASARDANPPAWIDARWLLPVALALHGAVLFPSFMAPSLLAESGPNLDFAHAVSLIAWLTGLVYWLASFSTGLQGLPALVAAFGAVAVLLPLLLPGEHRSTHAMLPLFQAHMIIALIAYSLFTVAAMHAAIMAAQEKHLRQAVQSGLFARLPPLMSMESMLFRLVGAGFVLLTMVVASGLLFALQVHGAALPLNHMTVFGIVSWLVFGGLLLGRRAWGWRGRQAARWTLTGFFFLVLAYLGTRFVAEVILGQT
jgi:ABC-type uncharacterized transport system permease subunit